MLAANLQPIAEYPGANAPWLCMCMECGREVAPRLGEVKRGSRCAFCAGIRVDIDEAVEVFSPPPARTHRGGANASSAATK